MPTMNRSWGAYGNISIQTLEAGHNSHTFYHSVSEDLGRINERPAGRTLLSEIEEAGPEVRLVGSASQRRADTNEVSFGPNTNVVIIPKLLRYVQSGHNLGFIPGASIKRRLQSSDHRAHNPSNEPFWLSDGCHTEAADNLAASNGSGSVAILRFNNNQVPMVEGVVTPSFIVLAHELIHALHMLKGIRSDEDEENWTRGVGRHSASALTENTIRKEWNLPLRTDAV